MFNMRGSMRQTNVTALCNVAGGYAEAEESTVRGRHRVQMGQARICQHVSIIPR